MTRSHKIRKRRFNAPLEKLNDPVWRQRRREDRESKEAFEKRRILAATGHGSWVQRPVKRKSLSPKDGVAVAIHQGYTSQTDALGRGTSSPILEDEGVARNPQVASGAGEPGTMMGERKSNDRTFEKVTSSDPTDVYHRCRIRCSEKGCDKTFIYARRGPINPIAAAKYFRDKGWDVGAHQRDDLCEDHGKGGKMGKSKTIGKTYAPANGGAGIQTKHTEINLGTDTAALPPINFDEPKISTKNLETLTETVPVESISEFDARTADSVSMSKADKRIISNKLDEVYVDELTGYRGNWNDAKVAIDLGVPQEWVSTVRDYMYGPEINREKQKLELDAIIVEMKGRLHDYSTNLPVIQAMITQYDKLSEELDEKLVRFEERATEMIAVIATYETKLKEWKGE